MKIFLVRHFQAVVPSGTCGGWSDWPLAPDWENQIENLLAHLPSNVARIESSPLARCRDLGEKLSAHFGVPLKHDDRLREIHFGAWENRAWNDIETSELNAWMENWVHVAPPGGENFLGLQARVGAWWRDLPLHDDPLVVVSHAGPMRALLAQLLGMPPENAFRLNIELGGVCMLQRNAHEPDAAVLKRLNSGCDENFNNN